MMEKKYKDENVITVKVFLSPKEENMILTHTYYNKFHGFVCELLGDNQYQNRSNNYTTTFICGGKSIDKGIVFTKNDVYFIFRTNDEHVWQNFLHNISIKVDTGFGFSITGYSIIENSLNNDTFETVYSTPILISKTYDYVERLSSDDIAKTEQYLKEGIFKKAQDEGFNVNKDLEISIEKQWGRKTIEYQRKYNQRPIVNRGRNLRVRIKCDEETKNFILVHGLGRSTGCGFGFLI